MSDSSLILPGQEAPGVDSMMAHMPDVVYLRNPSTGVIYKFVRPTNNKSARDAVDDTIRHALKGETGEGGRPPYTLSTEEACRAQAIELAKLQGRPLPAWAVQEAAEAEKPAPAKAK